MYEDLVKRLRDVHPEEFGDAWDFAFACQQAMHEAADAIEELNKVVKHQAEILHRYGGETGIRQSAEMNDSLLWLLQAQPQWISMTERLPEKMQYVLVRYKNNDMAVASWFGGDEDIIFWRAITDEGWCADCDTEPTHWMPLPPPPEEEGEQ